MNDHNFENRGEAVLRNTCANGILVNESIKQLIFEGATTLRILLITSEVYRNSVLPQLYTSKNATIFHSLDSCDKNTDSQATMAHLIEHSIGANDPGSSLGHCTLSLV